MGTVAVASLNPGKVAAAEQAFTRVWRGAWEVDGMAVESGVAEQPVTEAETQRGAWNRARAARAVSTADYVVGMEGGAMNDGMECGWVVVLDHSGRAGVAATARIMLPPAFLEEMKRGMPLGVLCARELGAEAGIGRTVGYFGLMTRNAVTRVGAYADAVAFALAPFVYPQLFTPVDAVVTGGGG